MKISVLLSVALGIAGVVMVVVLWTILSGMGVFDQINGIVGQVVRTASSASTSWTSSAWPGALAVDRHRGHRRHPGDRDRDPRGVPLQRLQRPRRRRPAHPHRRLTGPGARRRRAVLSAGAGGVTSCTAPPPWAAQPIAVNGPIAQTVRALP